MARQQRKSAKKPTKSPIDAFAEEAEQESLLDLIGETDDHGGEADGIETAAPKLQPVEPLEAAPVEEEPPELASDEMLLEDDCPPIFGGNRLGGNRVECRFLPDEIERLRTACPVGQKQRTGTLIRWAIAQLVGSRLQPFRFADDHGRRKPAEENVSDAGSVRIHVRVTDAAIQQLHAIGARTYGRGGEKPGAAATVRWGVLRYLRVHPAEIRNRLHNMRPGRPSAGEA